MSYERVLRYPDGKKRIIRYPLVLEEASPSEKLISTTAESYKNHAGRGSWDVVGLWDTQGDPSSTGNDQVKDSTKVSGDTLEQSEVGEKSNQKVSEIISGCPRSQVTLC